MEVKLLGASKYRAAKAGHISAKGNGGQNLLGRKDTTIAQQNILKFLHPPLPTLLLPDLEFVKKFTRPNFRAKKFYTLKTRKLRLFSPAINSENASLSVIWASFG